MKKGVKILSWLMALFLVSFLSYFIFNKNYEFSGYGLVVGVLFFVVIWADKYYKFPLTALWLFAIWVVLHMLGGSVYLNGTRLYDLVLFNIYDATHISPEFIILKYDQFVHAYCYVAFAVLVYFMLKVHMKPRQDKALITFTILAAVGIGLLNEVIEFGMVVFADAAAGVGGYYNTALDLVFNLIGAIIGAFLAKTVLE
jgi:putative membrane protein